MLKCTFVVFDEQNHCHCCCFLLSSIGTSQPSRVEMAGRSAAFHVRAHAAWVVRSSLHVCAHAAFFFFFFYAACSGRATRSSAFSQRLTELTDWRELLRSFLKPAKNNSPHLCVMRRGWQRSPANGEPKSRPAPPTTPRSAPFFPRPALTSRSLFTLYGHASKWVTGDSTPAFGPPVCVEPGNPAKACMAKLACLVPWSRPGNPQPAWRAACTEAKLAAASRGGTDKTQLHFCPLKKRN